MAYVGGLIQKTKWFNWDDAIRLGLLIKIVVVVQPTAEKFVGKSGYSSCQKAL